MDTDFAIATDSKNIFAIVKALENLNPPPWNYGEAVPFLWDERSVRGSNVSLSTLAGDVDLLLELPGIDSFEGLWQRSIKKSLDDIEFHVASIDDLITMKRVAGRPNDIVHLAELARLRKISGLDS